MSQPCGGLSRVGQCHQVAFPQVKAFSNVGQCHREPTTSSQFVRTLWTSKWILAALSRQRYWRI
jgi:hypothetical protein